MSKEIFEKPKGEFRCPVCDVIWNGTDLYKNLRHTRLMWVCPSCQGNVIKINSTGRETFNHYKVKHEIKGALCGYVYPVTPLRIKGDYMTNQDKKRCRDNLCELRACLRLLPYKTGNPRENQLTPAKLLKEALKKVLYWSPEDIVDAYYSEQRL